MSLELATAFIRIAIERNKLISEVGVARRQAERQLSGLKVKIDRGAFTREAAQAGAQAGRAAKQAFTGAFRGAMPPGWMAGATRVSPFSGNRGIGIGTAGNRPIGFSPAWASFAQGNPFAAQMAWNNRNRRPPGRMGGGGGGGGFGGLGMFGRRPSGGRGGIGSFVQGSAETAVGILGYRAAIAAMSLPAEAIRTTADFEREMIRLKSATEATTVEFAGLKSEALSLSRTTIFDPTQVAHAMRIIGEKGLNAQQTKAAAPAVLNFAAGSGGKVNVEESADVLIGIMNSMQIPMEEMVRVSDILTRSALKSSTDVHELGEAFKYVGPLAHLGGIQIEEAAAAMSLLSKNMLGGSIGGTGFKRIITDLMNPKRMGKLSGLVGANIQSTGADGGLRSLADIIDDVNAALKASNKEAQAGSIAIQVFGQRAGPQFAAFLQEGGSALRDFERLLKESSITAKKMADQDFESLGGSLDRISSSFEQFKIKFMDPFGQGMRKTTEDVVGLIDTLGDLWVFLHGFDPFDLALGEPGELERFQRALEKVGRANPWRPNDPGVLAEAEAMRQRERLANQGNPFHDAFNPRAIRNRGLRKRHDNLVPGDQIKNIDPAPFMNKIFGAAWPGGVDKFHGLAFGDKQFALPKQDLDLEAQRAAWPVERLWDELEKAGLAEKGMVKGVERRIFKGEALQGLNDDIARRRDDLTKLTIKGGGRADVAGEEFQFQSNLRDLLQGVLNRNKGGGAGWDFGRGGGAIGGLGSLLGIVDNAIPRRQLEDGLLQGLGAILGGGMFGGLGAGLSALGGFRALGKGPQLPGIPGFSPSFVGIEELSKQIQLGVLSREEKLAQDALIEQKKVVANTNGLIPAIRELQLGFV